MATVISIALQKGGSAKTTTAINLAANLAYRNKRVLLVDMDGQANATFGSGINGQDLANSTYNVLTTDQEYACDIKDAILQTKYYDILPGDKDVADLSTELKSLYSLKQSIDTIRNSYDFIIIDCPPALNIISQNAFVASDHIIIPAEPKPFHFTGLVDMKDTIDNIKQLANPKLSVLGILLVKYNRRTNLTRTMHDLIANYASSLQTTVYSATIREGIAVSESQMEQLPLIYYAPSANPTIDYKAFTTETLKRLEVIKNGKKA